MSSVLTASRMLEFIGDIMNLPSLILAMTHYIKWKTYFRNYTVATFLYAVHEFLDGSFGWMMFNASFCAVGYLAWKYGRDDDDDRPKRKRQALKSKFEKFIPKPVTAPPLHNPV